LPSNTEVMKKIVPISVLFIFSLFACIEEPDFSALPVDDMSELSVPDGFEFKSEESFDLVINLDLEDTSSYARVVISSDNDRLFEGVINPGTTPFNFDLPFHKEDIEITAYWNDRVANKTFEKYEALTLSLNQESFSYEGVGSVAFAANKKDKDDADSDGVKDKDDLEPNNPLVAQAIYIPAFESFNTIGFEDAWPSEGDYDFNDLVVSFNLNKFMSKKNQLARVETHFKVLAIGAGYNNDFCYTIDIPADQLTIEVSDASLAYEVLGYDGITEVRFEKIKSAFGTNGFVNTVETDEYFEPLDFTITSTVNEKYKANGNDLAYDFFIRINGEEGREVHVAGKHPTGKVNRTYFGTAADNSKNGQYYVNKRNLPWAVMIPEIWEYPAEKIEIISAYPDFIDFAQKNSNMPWYSDFHGGNVNRSKLFKKKR